MASRRNPLLDRALLEAATQYEPQENALRSLLSGLAGSYTRGRRVAASNERAIVAATQAARPQVSSVYDDAVGVAQAQVAQLGDNPEAQAYQRRLGEARANALNDLTQRSTAASEGRVYANQGARSDYLANKERIAGQLQDLAGQRGATATSLYGKLRDAQLQRGIQRGSQTETARHNRAQESVARQNATTAKARAQQAARAKTQIKWASPQAHAQARDLIERAVAEVHDLRLDANGRVDPHASRADIIGLLIDGVPAGKDDQGKPIPAVRPMPPDLVRIASNLVFEKSLSPSDVKRLHARGLRVRTLQYPTRLARPPRAKHGAVEALQGLAQRGPRLVR